jgi:hypothetical protein
MLDIRHAEEFLIVDVAGGFVHPRLLANLIGDGRADIVGFGDAEGALIEVASRYSHVFRPMTRTWGWSRRRELRSRTPHPRDEGPGEEVRSLSCDLRI